MAKIQLVIVTPETTTFDEEVDSVVLPMVDGESGILPGHAPMIGRLGPGELRATSGNATHRFYVDGGFVQVEGAVVTVLPGKSVPAAEITPADAQAELDRALAETANNSEAADIKAKQVAQARARVRVASRS